MIWATIAIAVVGIAASGHAQTTAQPKAEADECLSRPGKTTPKGSHWFYRIERPSQRRCWYLGPASQKVRAERAVPDRATAAERRAVPLPVPAPSELRADEQMRDEAPTAMTSEAASAAPVDTSAATASSVTATQFSATWPAGSSALSEREVPPAIVQERVDEVATADAQTEEMPAVWPVMSAADRAAAQAEGKPGIGHLLIFLAATIAFVGIAIRTVLKFTASARQRHELPPRVRVAEPVIRPRMPPRAPDPVRKEGSIEAMSEPTIARLREIAKRWDKPTRVPRQPRIPAFEVEPDYEVKQPPKRRAMA
jgi:hypothetical protein